MNKERRKRIAAVIDQLDHLQTEIDDLYSEESESFEAMPESMQYTECGDSMQENIDTLESARNSANEAIDYLQEILSK